MHPTLPSRQFRIRGSRAAIVFAAALSFAAPAVGGTMAAPPPSHSLVAASSSAHADFAREQPAPEVRHVADWIARTHDNGSAPFLIVDKRHARLFVFDREARLVANAPVLLGLAKGDDSVPGIGDKKIADIKPHERTTPAGRFLADSGPDLRGEEVVWIDYDAAVSMHRVITSNPKEHRAERLATPTYLDNRISYGCINVPHAFFDAHVAPIFSDGRQAPVYVLPDVKPLRAVFPGYDGPDSAPVRAGSSPRGAKIASAR